MEQKGIEPIVILIFPWDKSIIRLDKLEYLEQLEKLQFESLPLGEGAPGRTLGRMRANQEVGYSLRQGFPVQG